MRVATLFSGGKDSTYATYVALQRGWDLAALISIRPSDHESMLFHVPNIELTRLHAEAIGIPLIKEHASAGEGEELASLERAFGRTDADAIIVGAIESDYQYSRVNRAAHAVGLRVFAPLWRQDPGRLVREYLEAGFRIVFSSVSADGLDASWLGRTWDETVVEDLLRLHGSKGVHPCGEGGEFETLVLDAPFFRKSIEVVRATPRWSGGAGVWQVEGARLRDKDGVNASGWRGSS